MTSVCDVRLAGRIKACLFDLDGTLIDSEPLKNLAHVQAVQALAGGAPPPAEEVVAAATNLIGVPTPETAIDLIGRFGLERAVSARQHNLGLDAAWKAYAGLQQELYQQLQDQPGALERVQLPHAVSLLRRARTLDLKTGLATMSFRRDVQHTLGLLGWSSLFDAVLTGDQVSRGKPDPEIYLRLAAQLKVDPEECLVLEDSPSGVGAALAAGMVCVAVPNELTREVVLSMKGIDPRTIVLDPSLLLDTADRLLRYVPQRGSGANKLDGE